MLISHSVLVLKGNSFLHPTPQRHSKEAVMSEASTLQPLTSSESVQQSLKSLMSRATQRRKKVVDVCDIFQLIQLKKTKKGLYDC